MEQKLGFSFETTIAAFGAVMATICAVLGNLLEMKELSTIGITVLGASMIFMGRRGRRSSTTGMARAKRSPDRGRPDVAMMDIVWFILTLAVGSSLGAGEAEAANYPGDRALEYLR